MIDIDTTTLLSILSAVNTAVLAPILRYTITIERRLTRLETFIEAGRLLSRAGDPPAKQ